jgi:hypothetical protein
MGSATVPVAAFGVPPNAILCHLQQRGAEGEKMPPNESGGIIKKRFFTRRVRMANSGTVCVI